MHIALLIHSVEWVSHLWYFIIVRNHEMLYNVYNVYGVWLVYQPREGMHNVSPLCGMLNCEPVYLIALSIKNSNAAAVLKYITVCGSVLKVTCAIFKSWHPKCLGCVAVMGCSRMLGLQMVIGSRQKQGHQLDPERCHQKMGIDIFGNGWYYKSSR